MPSLGSMSWSRIIAVVGAIVGVIGTLAYFGFMRHDRLGLLFSVIGCGLGMIALFLPPRSIWFGVLALVCSGSPLAFVLVSLMLGNQMLIQPEKPNQLQAR